MLTHEKQDLEQKNQTYYIIYIIGNQLFTATDIRPRSKPVIGNLKKTVAISASLSYNMMWVQ